MEGDSQTAEAMRDWFDLCHRGGVGLAAAAAMAGTIVEAYTDPRRHYHDLVHVQDCLTLLAEASLGPGDSVVAELAVWFHDVVYEPGRADNEAASARLAREWLAAQGLDAEPVAAIIEMTAGHGLDPGADAAARAVHDVDLAVLGASPSDYERYVRAIRLEYSHVPDDRFREGRRAVVERLLAEPVLYALPRFRSVLEDRARTNLATELEALARPSGAEARRGPHSIENGG